MKNISIFKITFYIVIIIIINSFLYLTAFSQTNLNNFFASDFSTNGFLARGFAQERQFISVNLLPRYSAIFPPFVNSLTRNIDTFTGLAKINLDNIKAVNDVTVKDILNSASIKGNFWYIPNISYTFLFNRIIGIEFGIGVNSASYSFNIPKDNMQGILEAVLDIDSSSGFTIPDFLRSFQGENMHLKASFYYIPMHIGLKVLTGKTHKLVNTFRFGIEALVYNIDVENIFSGEQSRLSSSEATVYLSYELGWQIDLFPNKNWRVKPYIDFSLFEIGFYIRGATKGIYNDVRNSILRLGDVSSIPKEIPGGGKIELGVEGNIFEAIGKEKYEWDNLPSSLKFVAALKIAIFPRFGFTIRF